MALKFIDVADITLRANQLMSRKQHSTSANERNLITPLHASRHIAITVESF
ncbi:MAG: hypothetical protein ACLPX5_03165 [Dissulfurispiraceae bacterium]